MHLQKNLNNQISDKFNSNNKKPQLKRRKTKKRKSNLKHKNFFLRLNKKKKNQKTIKQIVIYKIAKFNKRTVIIYGIL